MWAGLGNLSECELVLCVYKRRRPIRVHPIDAARSQHAIDNDILNSPERSRKLPASATTEVRNAVPESI
jgi:hypothetical protein